MYFHLNVGDCGYSQYPSLFYINLPHDLLYKTGLHKYTMRLTASCKISQVTSFPKVGEMPRAQVEDCGDVYETFVMGVSRCRCLLCWPVETGGCIYGFRAKFVT